jgi:hypothetical protein
MSEKPNPIGIKSLLPPFNIWKVFTFYTEYVDLKKLEYISKFAKYILGS